jgi:hypothetical protein
VSQYFVPDEGGDSQSLSCVDVPVMSVNGGTLARCAGLRRHSFRLVLGSAIDDGQVLTVLCQRACDGGIDTRPPLVSRATSPVRDPMTKLLG